MKKTMTKSAIAMMMALMTAVPFAGAVEPEPTADMTARLHSIRRTVCSTLRPVSKVIAVTGQKVSTRTSVGTTHTP